MTQLRCYYTNHIGGLQDCTQGSLIHADKVIVRQAGTTYKTENNMDHITLTQLVVLAVSIFVYVAIELTVN